MAAGTFSPLQDGAECRFSDVESGELTKLWKLLLSTCRCSNERAEKGGPMNDPARSEVRSDIGSNLTFGAPAPRFLPGGGAIDSTAGRMSYWTRDGE